MSKEKLTGLLLGGSLKQSGVTFYMRNGRVVVRSAHSNETRSNTRKQFDARQRLKHTVALWKMLKPCEPMFDGGKSAYGRFASLANRLPVVYLPSRGNISNASLLMPDMPVSDGVLPAVKEWLDTVEDMPALMTDLKAGDLKAGDELKLYELVQTMEGEIPVVRISCRNVDLNEMTEVDGQLALVGEVYGDTTRGWALVRVSYDRCSSQAVVTKSTYYELYTTEKAMQEAAKTYGGLSD